MTHKLGAHMSIAGGYDRAVISAARLGMHTVQLFTKSNNQWRAKPLADADVAAFRKALEVSQVRDPVAHNSYLINLGSPDDELWRKSIDAMVVELERAQALGIADLVAHPGAHVGSGEAAAIKRIARAIDQIHKRTRGFQVRIDLENTAGQGSCLGHRLDHLRGVIDRVREPERLGVCLDSCHLFAAGYLMNNEDLYNQMIYDLERTLGFDRLRVWHLNDSCKPCGSRVDRHAGIGRGLMGVEPFRFILQDHRFDHVPMILETPKGLEEGVELDAINLATLCRLEGKAGKQRTTRKSPSRMN